MSLRQSDYLLRLIEELTVAIRRIRERLAGDTTAPDELLAEIRAAQAALLGDRQALLTQLDEATAVTLLADHEQLPTWIELIRLEAEALRRLGAFTEAEEREARAQRLEDSAS